MEKFYGGTGAWGDALAVQKFITALTKMKVDDTKVLDQMRDTKTLSENQKKVLDSVKKHWEFQITRLNGIGTDKDGRPSQDNEHPGVAYGHDYGIDLAEWENWANEHKELWFRRGGAATDTVPALLTPGEFVINKAAVQKMGAGFFDAINQMKAPAQALIEPVKRLFAGGTVAQGFADGGEVEPPGQTGERGKLRDGEIRVRSYSFDDDGIKDLQLEGGPGVADDQIVNTMRRISNAGRLQGGAAAHLNYDMNVIGKMMQNAISGVLGYGTI
ncbi:hypothetical protein CCP4SC76_5480001 [Gammaproteobacteria bacterium]